MAQQVRRACGWLFVALAVACGSDKKPAADCDEAADDCSQEGDGDGDGTGDGDGDGMGDGDGDAPEIPVLDLKPGAEIRLDARYNAVCDLSEDGELKCREHDTEWEVVETEKLRSFDLGDFHGCGITESGELACWGAGSDPEYLDCDWVPSESECGQAVAPEGQFKEVAAGDKFTCGIRQDGSIACWGWADGRRLEAPEGTGFTKIAGGQSSMCAIHESEGLKCWGGASGKASVTDVVQLSVGNHEACWITEDGTLGCTGGFHFDASQRYAQVSINAYGGCALAVTGRVQCEGFGEFDNISPPVEAFVEIASGTEFACGRLSSGPVECWGNLWGTGGDTEQCALNSAQLKVGDGSNVTLLPVEQVSQFGMGGAIHTTYDMGLWGHAELVVAYAENGEPQELFSGFFMGAPTAEGPGPILCAVEGSGSTVTREGDELVLDLKNVHDLGPCPGKPVEGSLTFCEGPSCDPELDGGSLEGIRTSNLGEREGLEEGAFRMMVSGLDIRGQLSEGDEGSVVWGVMLSSKDSPWGKHVYCVGESSTVEKNDDGTSLWELRNLSVLGECEAGNESATGCIRD